MPTQYDPQILQDYADDLYKQAKSIIVQTAIKYGALCFVISLAVVGVVVAQQSGFLDLTTGLVIVVFVTCLGVAAGISVGTLKAFQR
ncbi:MAG: hypothetical protein WB993_09450 [Candidatus Sulfotelmatobacter sp.]